MPKQTPAEIRQHITHTLIDSLESGNLPFWRRPWSDDPNAPGLHTSLSTGSFYRGINQLIFLASGARQQFKSKWWGTYNQIRHAGASVCKGQRATQIVLFKPVKRTRIDEAGDEVNDSFLVMRTFSVFNAEQTNGLDQFRVGFSQPTTSAEERHERAEAVIDAISADIRFGGNRAFYSLAGDYIQMPYRHQFESATAYYETLCHELVHYSEHSTRLNWNRPDEGYADGELVAEMGACFLLAELGLPTTSRLENHAAYLKSWLKGMNDDPTFIFKAAAQASKAVDSTLR